MDLETAHRVLDVPHGTGMEIIGRLYAEKRSELAACLAQATAPEDKAAHGRRLGELDEAFTVVSRAAAGVPPHMPKTHAGHARSATTGGFPWMPVIGVTVLAATVLVSLMFWNRLGRTDGRNSHEIKVVNADAARNVTETKTVQTTGPSQGNDFKNSIGMEMVWIDPLKLWVGKYEVTQEEYQAITGSNPSFFDGARRPVENVSWNDAISFISRLNERDESKFPEGFAYRLPLDAEYDVYVGNTSLDDAVTSLRGSRFLNKEFSASVGSLEPNNFGLYDTRGNVWEWMNDWDSADIARKDSDPSSDAAGTKFKILRGGSWYADDSELLAVACRLSAGPAGRGGSRGFRVVLGPVSR